MTMTGPQLLAAVSLAEIEPNNRLLSGYLQRAPQVADLFACSPTEILPCARQARAQADRAVLADALDALQQRLDAELPARENARLLADPTTPVVTVGQQSCLFTGPLYTLYKALTAIDLAARLTAELGRTAVPVFWAATDDDDRGEADHCRLWDQHYRLHDIHYPQTAGAPGQLIGDLPARPAGDALIEQARELMQGLPYADDAVTLLRETLAGADDLGAWYCRLLARLCSRMGLVICDPRLPELRRLGGEVIRRELTVPLCTTELVNRQARVIQQRGFRPALVKPADSCNFFLWDGVRRRVSYRNGQFFAGGDAYTRQALLDLLDQHPERLLPNAVLRPLVQEYLFGSAAFVAGPNELGYWAELRLVFAALDVEMPPVVPRAGATLAPPAVARRLADWNVSPLDLLQRFEQVRYRLLEQREPAGVGQTFARSRIALERMAAELHDAVREVDATLAQSAAATHQRLVNELERLEKKTLKAIERQTAEHGAQLQQARDILYPDHGLQERALNVISLIARCGPEVIPSLRNLLNLQEGRHVFVEL